MIEHAFDKPGEHDFLGGLRSGWVHSDRAACVGHRGRQLRHRPRFSMRRHRAPSRKELAPLLDDIRQVMLSCHHRRSQPKRPHPVRQVVGHNVAGRPWQDVDSPEALAHAESMFDLDICENPFDQSLVDA